MSRAFIKANFFVSSTVSDGLNKNFSSSFKWSIKSKKLATTAPVNCMTRGTLKTSCSHLRFSVRWLHEASYDSRTSWTQKESCGPCACCRYLALCRYIRRTASPVHIFQVFCQTLYLIHKHSPQRRYRFEAHRCEKNVPLRNSGWGFWPVAFSNRSKSAASIALVPNCCINLS